MRRFDKPFSHRSVSSLVKCRIIRVHVPLRELESVLIPFDGFVGWAAHQTVVVVFSVACGSDSEIILAEFQPLESVIRTERHRLDADAIPMFSGSLTG